MKPEQKKAVNRTILQCRTILERDIENRLITYGILIDEPWVEKEKLSLSDEQEQIYKNLREAIGKEMKGGLSQKEALISYIREVTYTYLNRIAALRVMEVRGLIEEVLIQREEFGGRSYGHRNFFEIARDYCKSQSDEGLSYFISLIFNEIASDIGLLFNTDDEYSIIVPSNQALLEIIHLLTTEIDEESWRQDEIIGWIYQYFNEEEKKIVFKKKKFEVLDIPPATQLFTPDWIVKFILEESLEKLINDIKLGARTDIKLEDIKILDPACGSGHFLFQAYDILYNAYKDAGYDERKIPYLIINKNLYGIDVDARAVQLTSLILYLKLKTSLLKINQKGEIGSIKINLVCADSILLNGERLNFLLKRFKNEKNVIDIINIIYEEFNNTKLKGSLVQPEKKVRPIIDTLKEELDESFKRELDEYNLFSGIEYSEFNKTQKEESFKQLENKILKVLNDIYSQAIINNDIGYKMFANEAKKSIDLIEILMDKYDIVVTNPPYMTRNNMTSELNQFLDKNYKAGSADLYSAFIIRCLEFVKENGYVGMITQNTFMFKPSFKELRKELINNITIKTFVHLGPRAFDDISGEKVNTAMFIFRNKKPTYQQSLFINLTKYRSSELKKNALINRNKSETFEIDQSLFKVIEGYPFVYWMNKFDKKLLEKLPVLDNKSEAPIAFVRTGLTTGDDNKFVRFFWEVPSEYIGKEWKFISKGKEFIRWYESFDRIVYWSNNGYAIKNFRNSKGKLKSSIRGEEYYDKEGITYGMNSSSGFAARFLPKDVIISVNGSGIFPNKVSQEFLFGLLNSSLGSRLFSILAPMLTINNSDVSKFPIKLPDDETDNAIITAVRKIIPLAKSLTFVYEEKPDFTLPSLLQFPSNTIRDSYEKYIAKNIEIGKTIASYELYIDNLVYELYQVPEELRKYELTDKENIQRIVKAINDDNIVSILDLIELPKYIKLKDLSESLSDLISYFIGVVFGRWNFYTTPKIEDNIIVINETFVEDFLYQLLEEVFSEENIDEIIDNEIPSILKKDILEWLQKDFFNYHCRKYQNRPIYWHICSPNKTFNALLYYHELNSDTLYKLKSNYLKRIIENLKGDLIFYLGKISSTNEKKVAKQYEKKVVELENQINDLETLDRQIDDIIASGYEPDINQGVLYNIKPLNPIIAKKIEK